MVSVKVTAEQKELETHGGEHIMRTVGQKQWRSAITCDLTPPTPLKWWGEVNKEGGGPWGYEDVCWAGGLSSTHTVIQMANSFKATAQTTVSTVQESQSLVNDVLYKL